jgi:hypothetical protein
LTRNFWGLRHPPKRRGIWGELRSPPKKLNRVFGQTIYVYIYFHLNQMESIQEIDRILSPESTEYQHVQTITDYMRVQEDPNYRHLYDVMKKIQMIMPDDIFVRYSQEYLWILHDSVFKAPEIFFLTWRALVELLIKITDHHPHETWTPELKKCFVGEPSPDPLLVSPKGGDM